MKITTDPPAYPSHRYIDRQIFSMQFMENGSRMKLNLYKPGSPIHDWYTNSCNPVADESGPISSNSAFVAVEDNEEHEEFAVGMPFHGRCSPSNYFLIGNVIRVVRHVSGVNAPQKCLMTQNLIFKRKC